MTILYAILLGTAFGFVLQKSGAANPTRIVDMLRLTDFHLMKTILFAIGAGSFLLYLGLGSGLINESHLSIKSAYPGVMVGGGLLGLGWAIAGFCPGTGIVAAGTGRKDAVVFIVGGLAGALVYMLVFTSIESSSLFNLIGSGKITLVGNKGTVFGGLPTEFRILGIVFAIASLFIIIAWLLPTKINDETE